MPTKDPYELLGVARGASGEDVRRAYRSLVRQHHPDANPEDPTAEERFKKIQGAYEVLSDPGKRREYDERTRSSTRRNTGSPRRAAGGRPRHQTTGSVDLSDLLARLDKASGGRKEVNRQLRAEDLTRISRLLGLDLTRISKLLGENIKIRTNASFEGGRPGGSRSAGEGKPGGKPPKPAKPPKPPKTGKPGD